MSIELESVKNIVTLKSNIEKKTGGTYANLTKAVQSLTENIIPQGYYFSGVSNDGKYYIDTGYKPNQNTKIEIVYLSNESTGAICACDVSWGNQGYGLWQHAVEFGKDTTTFGAIQGSIITVICENGVFTRNGSVIASFSSNTFQSPQSLYLFALNRNNVVNELINNATIYSCKMWENGVPVRNFIPCLNGNKQLGMYDSVNKKFYSLLTP